MSCRRTTSDCPRARSAHRFSVKSPSAPIMCFRKVASSVPLEAHRSFDSPDRRRRPRSRKPSLRPSAADRRAPPASSPRCRAFDELAAIRERYWLARGRTPMVLTLTTTQDCNLGCYYCYESRSGAALNARDIPAIVNWVRDRLSASAKDSIHVDWYGGEPLLNLEFVENASAALQGLCAELDVSYSASIISNGTCWPEDLPAFIRRHRIRQVQISFDGLKENHDKRRRYRRGRSPQPCTDINAASFSRAEVDCRSHRGIGYMRRQIGVSARRTECRADWAFAPKYPAAPKR